MNVRILGTVGVLILVLLLVPESAQPQAKPPDGSSKGSGSSNVAPGEPGSADFEIRALATIMDSERKEESKDPAKWAKDPDLLDDVRTKATRKTPISRYRLAYPYDPKTNPPPQGYYGIDVYEKGEAKLLQLEGGSGETAWKKPVRDGGEEKVFTADLQDVELWSRVIAGQTEVLARCARDQVTLEMLVRHKDKEAAAKDVRERFKLFYDNAATNRLFGGGEDDYWKWFVRFGSLCEDRNGEITSIIAILGVKANERRKLLALWQGILQTENLAWPPEGNFLYEWAALMAGREQDLQPLSPPIDLAKTKARRDEIAKKYIALHAEQAELVDEAQLHMQAILNSIEATWKAAQKNPKFATEDERKHLEESYGYWKDQQALLKMRLYDAAGWYKPEEMPQIVKDLKLDSEVDDEIGKMIKVKLLLGEAEELDRRVWLQRTAPAYSPEVTQSPVETLSRAKRLDAVAVLHDILKQNPQNREARNTLRDQEYLILGWIAGKQQREKRASWAAFEKYFTNRGYDAQAPETTWEGIKETGSVVWGNLWSTVGDKLSDWPWEKEGGTVLALADAISKDEENAAANLVTLNVLRRLSRNGLLLSEIRGLKEVDFSKHTVLIVKDKQGNEGKPIPMPAEKVKRLRLDMFSAFNDPPLGLADLAVGNGDAFCASFNKTYYDVYDPSRGWADTFGDFLSPSMLVLAVPFGSPVGWVRDPAIANRWGFIRKLPEEYKTVGALAGDWYKSTRFAELLSKSSVGMRIARDMDFVNGLGRVEWATRVAGGRLAAACGVYVGALSLADDYNVPGARLLVRCTFELGAPELVYAIFGAAHVPQAALLDKVERYSAEASQEAKSFADKAKTMDECDKIVRTLPEVSTEAELKELKATPVVKEGEEIARKRDKTLPFIGINSFADLQTAIVNFAKAAGREDTKEMKRISAAMKDLRQRIKKNLDKCVEEAVVALKIYSGWEYVEIKARGNKLPPMHAETPPPFVQTESVYKKTGGDKLFMADQFLRDGEWTAAREAASEGSQTARSAAIADDDLKALCEDRKVTATMAESESKLRAAAQKAAKAANSPNLMENIAKPISKEEIEALAQKGTFVKALGDSTFFVELEFGGTKNKYFVKTFEAGKGAILSEEDFAKSINNACISAMIAREIEAPAPAARAAKLKFLKDTNGKDIKEQLALVTRVFDGVELWDLRAGQALAYKEEIAKVRGLRMGVGDFDGNGRNIMISRESGAVVGIDLDQSHFIDNLGIKVVPDFQASSVKEYLVYIRDLINLQFGRNNKAFHGCPTRIDEFIRYKDVKPTLDRFAEKFGGEAGEARLRKIFKEGYEAGLQPLTDTELDKVVQTIQERIAPTGDKEAPTLLHQMMQERFPDKIKPPKKTSWRVPATKNETSLCRADEPMQLVAA